MFLKELFFNKSDKRNSEKLRMKIGWAKAVRYVHTNILHVMEVQEWDVAIGCGTLSTQKQGLPSSVIFELRYNRSPEQCLSSKRIARVSIDILRWPIKK